MSVCTRKRDGAIFIQWQEEGKTKRKFFGTGEAAVKKATLANHKLKVPSTLKSINKTIEIAKEQGINVKDTSLGIYINKAITAQIADSTDVESTVAKELAFILKGMGVTSTLEVPTPVGFIDIATNTEIIEVKYHQQWKSALGQILAYKFYTPDRNTRIHLFDKPNIKNAVKLNKKGIQNICEVCFAFGVNVSFREGDKYEFFNVSLPCNMVYPQGVHLK